MPEYLSPGVYVEELSTGPRPIEGVSTSTLGFVGQTERGPTRPRLITSFLDYSRLYGGLSADPSYLPYAIKGFFDNGGQRAYLTRVTGNGAALATTGQDLIISAIGPGGWGNGLFARIDAGKRSGFRLTILYYASAPAALQGDPLDLANRTDPRPNESEVYDNLSADPASSTYVVTVVNGGSHLVQVDWAANHQAGAAPAFVAYTKFQNGANGAAAGLADYNAGLGLLDSVDDISILCIPDEVRPGLGQIRADLQEKCELNRYRFAILQVDQGQADAGALAGNLGAYTDSQYVGLYYPWINIVDETTDETILIPPGGHVAGIYARTDEERGVHKAPANEEVRGILLADRGDTRPLEKTVTKGEQDELNPVGVNVIRDFRHTNRGIRVWGARTRSSDPSWKYVNVRRLFIFLEKSIDEGTQWVVFEPNDEPTWAAVRRTITNFLVRVWRDGALMGPTQDDAFFVKCDRTTMTEDDILNGRLICYVGVAPVRPAEFVIIRISQKTIEAPQ